MLYFERKTLRTIIFALGLAGLGYLGFVAGLIWPAANYLSVLFLLSGFLILTLRKDQVSRVKEAFADFANRAA